MSTIREIPLVARISREDFQRIHAYCQEHDVEGSTSSADIYDAPSGGAINVWTQPWGLPHLRAGSQLCGTFYPEREDYLHPGVVLESQMVAVGAGRTPRGLGDPTGLSGGEEILPSRNVNVHWDRGDSGLEHIGYPPEMVAAREAAAWDAEQAKAHFRRLYETVLGKPMPEPSA